MSAISIGGYNETTSDDNPYPSNSDRVAVGAKPARKAPLEIQANPQAAPQLQCRGIVGAASLCNLLNMV